MMLAWVALPCQKQSEDIENVCNLILFDHRLTIRGIAEAVGFDFVKE